MDKYTLDNGLRVVVEKIPTCRSVAFGIWVKTGSRYESESVNGISHFIEHMLFKGTAKYSAKDIAEIFDGIGGNVNAFTSKEYTCYYCKVLDEHLPLAVEVLADMFFGSVFDAEELEKEKNVIFEEISMYEDTPDDMVHDLISKAAFGDHSLGYTIIGTQSNLSAMNSDTLRGYMKQHYTVSNTVISIAGNVSDDVIQLMEKHFSGFANTGDEESNTKPSFFSELQYHQKKTEQNHICMSFPGLAAKDDQLYAMVLLNNAIGGGMSSRLFQEIREKRGLAYSVYSYHTSYQDSGMFTIYTGTAPKQTEEVLKVTLEMMQDIKDKGIMEAELKKGKEQMKGSLILSLESTSSRMNRLGKNELMLGRHYSMDEIIERIEQVTMDDIRALTAKLMSEPFALAMVGQSNKAIDGLRRDQLV